MVVTSIIDFILSKIFPAYKNIAHVYPAVFYMHEKIH